MELAEREISSWIAGWSTRTPDKLAIRFEDRRISFRAMEERVARLAGALADGEAIVQGDRVAYLGQNAPELLDLLFGCARLGAILLPLSARMPAPELRAVLDNVEPRVLICEAEFAPTATEAADGLALRIFPASSASATSSACSRDCSRPTSTRGT